MKNQYFADRNDYFKYDLLIFLAEQLAAKKLSVIWMLTGKDSSSQGGMTDYRQGAGNKALFRFLKASLTEGRKVSRLREYFDKHHPKDPDRKLEYLSYREEIEFENSSRESYFREIPKAYLESAVIFLDPDIGLQPKSANKGNFHQYVKFEEVKAVYDRMSSESSLVIYQHPRHLSLNLLLYGLCYKLSEFPNCPTPLAITDNRVAFLILAKNPERQKEIQQLLHEYVRSNLQLLD